MAAAARCRRLEHDAADLRDLASGALVPEVYMDAAKGSHIGRVDGAQDLASFVNAEPALKCHRRIWQPSGLEFLKTSPGFEDVQGPVLPVPGGAGDTCVGHGAGFVEPVQRRQRPAPEVVSKPLADVS